MSNFIVNTDIPNLRVIIRDADQYSVNIVPGRISTLRSGSIITIADFALSAVSSSYAATASYADTINRLISGSVVITGSATITDNLSVQGIISAEQLLVSSSIIYASGSTKFGDSPEDTHQFTGSVLVQGPISASSGITGSFKGDGTQITGVPTELRISGSTGSDVLALLTDDLIVSGVNGITTVVTNNKLTIDVPVGLSASLYGTASVAEGIHIVSAGIYLTGSEGVIIPTPSGGLSYITTASYALTASYIESNTWNNLLNIPEGLVSSSVQTYYWPVQTALSASFATSASWAPSVEGTATWDNITNKPDGLISSSTQVNYTQIQNKPTTIATASYVQNAVSASYALTASYVSGAASTWDTISGKPSGLVSSSTQATTWTVATSSLSTTSSFALTASFAANASVPAGTLSSSTQVSALGFATTASNTFNGNQTITGSLLTNADTIIFSGSLTSTGSTAFIGNVAVTGSLIISGSSTLTNVGPAIFSGSLNVTNGITGSLLGTSSWASNAVTSSYVLTASYAMNGGAGGTIDTSSFATTGSNVFTNDQTISGSINLTNNEVVGDTITSTLGGTPIQLNYGITKGDLTNRFSGVKVRNYDYSGGNLAGEVSIWTDSEAQDFSTQRVVVDGFGNVEVTGSLTVTGTTNVSGSLYGTSSWAQNVEYTDISNIPTGLVSSSVQINTGSFTGSFAGTFYETLVSASYAVTASYAEAAIAIPSPGTISSSAQIDELGFLLPSDTGSFAVTASNTFIGDQDIIGNVKVTGSLTVSGSSTFTNVGPTILSGSVTITSGITGSLLGTSSWTSNVGYDNISNIPSGIVSSSAQTVANIAGQTIAPSTINATGVISGSSIQVTGNSTIGGNLTVTGTVTAASQSIQYVTSSQFNVATNKIIVNTNDSLRFGGLSVIDSGSTDRSGSLYWDSLNDRWLYEDVFGGAYSSAILVAGPKNTSTTGNERGLITGRVPVASGDDHIDTAPASSSIRVDFPSLLTHVEHGLYVTGSVIATAYTGSFTGSFTGLINSSSYVSPTGLPAGLVSSSTQIASFGTIRLTVGTSRANASAFYFNSNVRTAGDSASPGADTAFLVNSTGLSTVTVYLRQDNAGPNATVVGIAKNANGTAFSGATLITSSSLNLTQDTIQTYTFSGLTLNQFDVIHIYCDPTSTPGTMFGVVVVS